LSKNGELVSFVRNILTANGVYNGSAGAIRIIAPQVSGNGQINAPNDGRIRNETAALVTTVQAAPTTIAVAPAPFPIISKLARRYLDPIRWI
jgi:hypothetical protein